MTRRILAAAALSASLFAALLGGAAWAEEPTRRISVIGEGLVEAVPDMATITLGVTQEAGEARAAMQATSEAVAGVLERLAELGIAPRDLQTRELSLNPVWSELTGSDGKRRQITGFVASNTVMVRVRDLAGLGGILDAVLAEGANDFNGLRFGLQEVAPLAEEARRRAVADAIARAKLLADAAGVALGPVLSIDDHGGAMPKAEMSMRMSAASPPVAAGELSVSASVTVVFGIGE